MSFINDGLKRAQAAQQKNPQPLASLPPVAAQPRVGTGRLLPLLAVLLLAAACFFIGMAFAKRTPPLKIAPEKILNSGK